jgi:nucleoid-associated protein YgaU
MVERSLSTLLEGGAGTPRPEQGSEEPAAAAPQTSPEPPGSDPAELAEIEPGAAPSFDVVRIRPGGGAVIAGRAAPEAEVELRSGEQVIDRVRANRRGEWVAVPPEPLPAGDQELTVAARVADGPAVQSNEVLVVVVPEAPPPQPAPRVAAAPPPPQPAEVASARPPSEPLAVALPRKGGAQGRILQAPGRISTDGTLALMVLDYDDTGRIRLRGEALPGAPLRVYVDNQPAGAVVVEPSGQWSTVLQPVLAPGDYTLRLDQLDPSGKPTARLETPFTRASQPPVEGDVQVDFVIVQPGNSLWRIARRLFGEGVHYVHIYDANQGQIRDPDLIYPGQVFEVPTGLGTAG